MHMIMRSLFCADAINLTIHKNTMQSVVCAPENNNYIELAKPRILSYK